MPIYGLTDRSQGLPPCIGKLFKGEQRREQIDKVTKQVVINPKTGKPVMIHGRDLDHFRFEGRMPGVAEVFERAYPTIESRRSINCRVLGYDADSAFPAWYEFYGGSGLQRRCNGQHIVLECVEGKYKSYQGLSPELCPPCKGCPKRSEDPHLTKKEKDLLCSKVGRMRIVITELVQAGFIGYVAVETHGFHDIRELLNNISAIDPRRDFGLDKVSDIPFVLQRVQKEVWTPREKGARSRDKKWMLQLLVSPQWVASRASTLNDRLMRGADNPYALSSAAEVPLLPAAPVRALPESPRGTHPRGTDPMQTVYNFYRSLGLHPNHFSQHLRTDLQAAARIQLEAGKTFPNYQEIEQIREEDIPLVVGARLATYASLTGLFGETSGSNPSESEALRQAAYDRALDEARRWILTPEINQSFRSGHYGAVGMAWVQHLEELAEQLRNDFVEVSA